MSKSNIFENALLLLFFNAVAIPGLAEDHTTPVSLEIALHTASPGEAGDQSTNEMTWTGYARQPVVRTSSGWTVSGNNVVNAAAITFPQCTGGSELATDWSVGQVGSDDCRYYGSITTPLAISTGVTPSFAPGQLSITED